MSGGHRRQGQIQGGGVAAVAAVEAAEGFVLVRHHLLPHSRPQTSFNWFVNLLKTFFFFIWRRCWCILVLLLLALITVFLLFVFLQHARADKPGHLPPPPPPLTHRGHSSHNASSCLLPTDRKPSWGSRFLCPNLPGNPPLSPAHPQQIINNPNNAWGREKRCSWVTLGTGVHWTNTQDEGAAHVALPPGGIGPRGGSLLRRPGH